jgi:hypothetical protein
MLARLQCKYGQVPQVVEIMKHITAVMERNGWTLVGGYQTAIGRFHEIWDLWDVGGDPSSITRALEAARQDPEMIEWASKLPMYLESEETRYMEKLDYSLPD